jgi:hypothetical protein
MNIAIFLLSVNFKAFVVGRKCIFDTRDSVSSYSKQDNIPGTIKWILCWEIVVQLVSLVNIGGIVDHHFLWEIRTWPVLLR